MCSYIILHLSDLLDSDMYYSKRWGDTLEMIKHYVSCQHTNTVLEFIEAQYLTNGKPLQHTTSVKGQIHKKMPDKIPIVCQEKR